MRMDLLQTAGAFHAADGGTTRHARLPRALGGWTPTLGLTAFGGPSAMVG